MKSWLIFLSLITLSYSGKSQQAAGWLTSFNTFKTSKHTSIHTDIQLRSTGEFEHVQALLIRAGMNIHVSKRLTVTGGYAFIHGYRTIGQVSGYAAEHRSWEQLLYSHTLGRHAVSHRLRVEQRFISKQIVENNALQHDEYLYANRVRYFIRDVFPFVKQTDNFNKGLFAALQNEVFVNFGNTENVNGKVFDQNRFYAAMGYRFHKKFDLELGYMNQYIEGRSGFTNNHIIQLASYLRL